jgi:hypothetical protein
VSTSRGFLFGLLGLIVAHFAILSKGLYDTDNMKKDWALVPVKELEGLEPDKPSLEGG